MTRLACLRARKHLGARRGRRKAFALILVLFLVVLMAVTVAGLGMRTSGGYRLARSRAEAWKLYYASLAAVEDSKVMLWRDSIAPKKTPGIAGAPKPMKFTENGVDVVVIFKDEAGKIPVNGFAGADEARKKDLVLALARFFEALDLPSSTGLATSVRDYIDEDTEGMREQGAINRMVFDVSELVGAQGFSNKVLFRSKHPGVLPAPASCMSTWYTGNININSASALVLKALEPSLTDTDIERIIAARAQQPFSSAEDLAARSGAAAPALAELTKNVGFTSDLFTLKIEAREGEFVRRIEAVVWVESSGAHTSYIRDGWQEQEVRVAGLSGY